MSAVADRLVDNEEFLDSIIKNLEDVSVLCDLYKISRTKMLILTKAKDAKATKKILDV